MLKLSPIDSGSLFTILFLCHFSPSSDTFESILFSSNTRMFQSHLDFSPALSYGIYCPPRVLFSVLEMKIWAPEIHGDTTTAPPPQVRRKSCCFGLLLEVSEPENTSCFKVEFTWTSSGLMLCSQLSLKYIVSRAAKIFLPHWQS